MDITKVILLNAVGVKEISIRVMFGNTKDKMKGVAINYRDFRDFNLKEFLEYKRIKEDNYGFRKTECTTSGGDSKQD